MVVRCKCDAKKNARMWKTFVTVVRCDAKFDSIFASYLHFALYRNCLHFCPFWHILRFLLALFRTFWCINREISTKKVETGQKRENSAKSAMQMQNANAMQWGLTKSANTMWKSFGTTIPGRNNGILPDRLCYIGNLVQLFPTYYSWFVS